MKKMLPAVWTALALAAAAALGLSAPTLVSRWTDRGMENAPRSVEIERVSLSYFDDTAARPGPILSPSRPTPPPASTSRPAPTFSWP